MTLSKRLALLGVRSAVSTSRSRGVGSSYALMDRRPFPYRQISTFTNHSKNSEMETLEDDSSPQLIKSIETENILRNLVEKNRAVVEKMRTEQAKAGYIYSPPTRILHSYYTNPLSCEFKSNMSKLHVQWEKNRKLLDELDELRMMESDLLSTGSRIAFEKRMKDSVKNNILSQETRRLTASTNTEFHIVGIATVLMMPVFFFVCLFFPP